MHPDNLKNPSQLLTYTKRFKKQLLVKSSFKPVSLYTSYPVDLWKLTFLEAFVYNSSFTNSLEPWNIHLIKSVNVVKNKYYL